MRATIAHRPTIADVAAEAGVSVATVDRVLNRRRPVKPDTADRVARAATALGYYGSPLLKRRLAELARRLRLGFVLQKPSKPFYRDLAEAIHLSGAAVEDARIETATVFVEELSPRAIVSAMRALADRCDALAIVAIDHPHIADEIVRLRGDGIPTVTFLTPLSNPIAAGHVGIDGRKAGRTAGWAMRRCARSPGSVEVLIGSHRYLGQEDREIGFRSYLRQHRAGFRVRDAVAYLDDEDGAYGAMMELLGQRRDAVGYYIVGGGFEGALAALREESLAGTVAFICHERNGTARDGLLDGIIDVVLDAPRQVLADTIVSALVQAITTPTATVGLIDTGFQIFTPENV